MPNPLTGDFEAVVQVAASQLNGLLGTLHQNGSSSDAPLRLLHSVRTRVGDVRRNPDLDAFGDWALAYQRARPAGPRPPLRDLLAAASPPGVARRIEGAFTDLDLVIQPPPPEVVRGTAALQLSTVRLGVADGSVSEITVHADVRALYAADPGTASLPAAINGEVRAVFEVQQAMTGGKTRLLIRPSPQDQRIEFIPAPGSGLTSTDAARIAVQVRKILREGLTLLPVDLPAGFPFTAFKALGGGATAAIGDRILPDGRTQSVAVGTVCQVGEPVVAFDAPSWWEPVMVPVWMPDLPESATLRDGIAAHISVATDRPPQEPMPNAVVFFPDWRASRPFDALARGLDAMRRQPPALTVFVIVPAGSLDVSRREFEARLAAFSAPVAARVQVAEDSVGGWARTFDVGTTPSLFLIDARRKVVWNASGDLAPADIAAALDQHVVPGPGPRFRPLRLRVSPGERAPDVYFRDDQGGEGALHRLRGQSVLLTFWQAWSAPCLAELRRLQALRDAEGRAAPFIVAFHGGAARRTFDDIRKEHGLSYPIVQDAEHRVARRFGVRCWPTTIAITPDGLIERIQLGIEPDAGRRPKDQAPLRA